MGLQRLLDARHMTLVAIFAAVVSLAHPPVDGVVFFQYQLVRLILLHIVGPIEVFFEQRHVNHQDVERVRLWSEVDHQVATPLVRLAVLRVDGPEHHRLRPVLQVDDELVVGALLAIGNEVEQRAVEPVIKEFLRQGLVLYHQFGAHHRAVRVHQVDHLVENGGRRAVKGVAQHLVDGHKQEIGMHVALHIVHPTLVGHGRLANLEEEGRLGVEHVDAHLLKQQLVGEPRGGHRTEVALNFLHLRLIERGYHVFDDLVEIIAPNLLVVVGYLGDIHEVEPRQPKLIADGAIVLPDVGVGRRVVLVLDVDHLHVLYETASLGNGEHLRLAIERIVDSHDLQGLQRHAGAIRERHVVELLPDACLLGLIAERLERAHRLGEGHGLGFREHAHGDAEVLLVPDAVERLHLFLLNDKVGLDEVGYDARKGNPFFSFKRHG